MEIWVLDKEFKSIGMVDEYSSLLWVERYNEPGEFELITIASEDMANLLQKDYYIWNKSSEMVCIIETIETTTDVEKGFELKVTGRSLESILERRIMWNKTKLISFVPYAIKKTLNENIIEPSIAERKISNFVYQDTTDKAIQQKRVNRQYVGETILNIVEEVCNESRIGFKIRLSNDMFIFTLYRGDDRSYSQNKFSWVIFSPSFDNIINSVELNSNMPYRNVALVAVEDKNTGVIRTTTVGNVTGVERRELYVDANDIQSERSDGSVVSDEEFNDSLMKRGEAKLNEAVVLKAFEGELETTQQFQYGRDFFMGDIVQLVNIFGSESRVRLIEITQKMDASGYAIYPTFVSVDGELDSEDSTYFELYDYEDTKILDGIIFYLYLRKDHIDPQTDEPLDDWNQFYNYWEVLYSPVSKEFKTAVENYNSSYGTGTPILVPGYRPNAQSSMIANPYNLYTLYRLMYNYYDKRDASFNPGTRWYNDPSGSSTTTRPVAGQRIPVWTTQRDALWVIFRVVLARAGYTSTQVYNIYFANMTTGYENYLADVSEYAEYCLPSNWKNYAWDQYVDERQQRDNYSYFVNTSRFSRTVLDVTWYYMQYYINNGNFDAYSKWFSSSSASVMWNSITQLFGSSITAVSSYSESSLNEAYRELRNWYISESSTTSVPSGYNQWLSDMYSVCKNYFPSTMLSGSWFSSSGLSQLEHLYNTERIEYRRYNGTSTDLNNFYEGLIYIIWMYKDARSNFDEYGQWFENDNINNLKSDIISQFGQMLPGYQNGGLSNTDTQALQTAYANVREWYLSEYTPDSYLPPTTNFRYNGNQYSMSFPINDKTMTLYLAYQIVGNQDQMHDTARYRFIPVTLNAEIYEDPPLKIAYIEFQLYHSGTLVSKSRGEVIYDKANSLKRVVFDASGLNSLYHKLPEDQSGQIVDEYSIEVTCFYKEQLED